MANFVLLFNGGDMPEGQAEQVASLQAWTTWYEKLGGAVVDGGNPFTPVAKHIASNGTVHDVLSASAASGYAIIKADSLSAAIELAKGCPILQANGQISVYETFNIM